MSISLADQRLDWFGFCKGLHPSEGLSKNNQFMKKRNRRKQITNQSLRKRAVHTTVSNTIGGPRLNPRLLFILTCSQQLDLPKKIFRVLIIQATTKTKEICCCLLVHNVAISVQEHKACPKADRAGYIIEFYIPIKPVL